MVDKEGALFGGLELSGSESLFLLEIVRNCLNFIEWWTHSMQYLIHLVLNLLIHGHGIKTENRTKDLLAARYSDLIIVITFDPIYIQFSTHFWVVYSNATNKVIWLT